MVKTPDNLTCLLDHGKLILPYRHSGGFECCDIRGLADGISKKSHRNAGLKVAHLDLIFHRRISLKARHGYQIHIVERQFRKLRNLRLNEHGGLCRVQAAGKVIQSHFDNVLANLFRIVRIVRKCLGIGDHNKNMVILAGVLKFYPAFQRTCIVAHMQSSCGTVPG